MPSGNTITESDFILPALRAIKISGLSGISTSDLHPILRDALEPQGEDLELLAGRGDDKFSQKVRNLKSHDRLEIDGLAKFEDGKYLITDAGKRHVHNFEGVSDTYRSQGFTEEQKIYALSSKEKYIFIEEGQVEKVSGETRRRSRKLRDFAIRHYSNNDGTIICEGCGFEGSTAYGEIGKGLIDIHHLEPISTSKEIKEYIKEAVKMVVPLCPTCHRIVHREKGPPMTIEKLQDIIAR